MEKSTKPQIISLPKIADPRGNLSVVESGKEVPFSIERVFYLYDVPADSERGGHAHHQAWQLMIAVAGSFDVVLDNGAEQRRYTLNRPYQGLLIPPGFWRTMDNFSSGSVCMVITNIHYSEDDYIRDYAEFKQLAEASPRNF
ncbi:MAG: FdtA/QdtA family cupin domain-containing protein [Muribaculaceae bacterium]|mgnify:FL=1|nr:FdtA/QdtA family cupin domain-containing protein [Muribaculaceae bacterium]